MELIMIKRPDKIRLGNALNGKRPNGEEAQKAGAEEGA